MEAGKRLEYQVAEAELHLPRDFGQEMRSEVSINRKNYPKLWISWLFERPRVKLWGWDTSLCRIHVQLHTLPGQDTLRG